MGGCCQFDTAWNAVTMTFHIPVRGKVERCLDLTRVGGWALGACSVAPYDIINTDTGGSW
jgi:hypothetical protein